MSRVLLQSLVTLGLATLAITQTANPVVDGENVSWVGLSNSTTKLDYFLGVPFAQPPVGSLRFKAPLLWTPSNSSQTINATAYGASCEQGIDQGLPLESEDCLTLNICTSFTQVTVPSLMSYRNIGKPSNVTGKIPVMVWLCKRHHACIFS
jgi:carboxylesterase type B